MRYVYFDMETSVSKDVTLRKMTLLGYLARAKVLGGSFALDDEDPQWFTVDQLPLDYLRELCLDEDVTWVAHLAAFDVRVLVRKLGLPYPRHVQCSLELACGAFPNHPGGYSLGNLGKTLYLGEGVRKLGDGSKVMAMTPAEIEAYCNMDTRMCREVAKMARRHLCPQEVQVAVLANYARELSFQIDADGIAAASDAFSKITAEAAAAVVEGIGQDGKGAFGWDGDVARSVKPATLKNLLLENLGFSTQSISIKKINPEKLRVHEEAGVVLRNVARANKAMSQNRRVKVFSSSSEVTCELGYFRAHTGRYSSPSVGKGLNLHNLNKRDPKVSKAIRSIFKLPEEMCFVCADEANVEYRELGQLCSSAYINSLFSANIFADPYAAFWLACTGIHVTKKDPARQVAKAAVLGLGFLMGLQTWIYTLMQALSDPTMELALADLQKICEDMGWRFPNDQFARQAQLKLNAPDAVVTVAYHTREMFHQIHPEVRRLAVWLELTVTKLSGCLTQDAADRVLENAYRSASAPKPDLLQLSWTDRFEGITVQARCGDHWQETVTWRDLGIRPSPFGGACLTYMAGNKGYRPVTKNLLIENVTQAAARNGTVQAKLELHRRGYRHILSVHDEVKLAVPRTVEAVLRARQDLLEVMGPGGYLANKWDWAIVIDPNEISVSSSLYELQQSPEWWAELATHPEYLDVLP